MAARRPPRFRGHKFRGFHHLQLAWPVGSEAEARRFFVEVVGLEPIPKPAHLAVRGGVWFRVGAHELHIGADPEFRPQVKGHPAFEVEGLPALRARLRRAGVKVWSDLPLPGHRRFYATDPVGNRLEFVERRRSRPRGPARAR
jgi:catechol 2,3-dioxygenase-like lactoylglutathione lyase family enzyme